jgi:hypothetical protein
MNGLKARLHRAEIVLELRYIIILDLFPTLLETLLKLCLEALHSCHAQIIRDSELQSKRRA